jgi:DNA mismatch repair protein MutS2
MGFEGVVTNVAKDSAEVDIQGKRLLAPLGDLRMIDQGSHKFSPPAKVSVQLPELNESLAELNVIGCTIDEALTRTEAFLDKALLADQSNLRVIHGHGTGRLRRAIANLLDDHRIVERYYTAPPEEGGGGVTVVTLKD